MEIGPTPLLALVMGASVDAYLDGHLARSGELAHSHDLRSTGVELSITARHISYCKVARGIDGALGQGDADDYVAPVVVRGICTHVHIKSSLLLLPLRRCSGRGGKSAVVQDVIAVRWKMRVWRFEPSKCTLS